MKYLLIKFIDFYQTYLSFDSGLLRILSPGGACRHQPRCSEYTKQMIIKTGVFKGSLLGLKRIITCW